MDLLTHKRLNSFTSKWYKKKATSKAFNSYIGYFQAILTTIAQLNSWTSPLNQYLGPKRSRKQPSINQ